MVYYLPGVRECEGSFPSVPGLLISKVKRDLPYKPVLRARIRSFSRQTPLFWSSFGLMFSCRVLVSSISAFLSKFRREIVFNTNRETSAAMMTHYSARQMNHKCRMGVNADRFKCRLNQCPGSIPWRDFPLCSNIADRQVSVSILFPILCISFISCR